MTTEYVLWALPKGQTDRMHEQVMTSTTDKARIARVRKLAEAEGWHGFRVRRLPARLRGGGVGERRWPVNPSQLSEARAAYVRCALWASTDAEGNPLDYPGFLLPDALREDLERDVDAFVRCHPRLCHEALDRPGYSPAMLGHDLWLSRNGHGAGFWDREQLRANRLGDALHSLAESMGDRCLSAEGREVCEL